MSLAIAFGTTDTRSDYASYGKPIRAPFIPGGGGAVGNEPSCRFGLTGPSAGHAIKIQATFLPADGGDGINISDDYPPNENEWNINFSAGIGIYQIFLLVDEVRSTTSLVVSVDGFEFYSTMSWHEEHEEQALFWTLFRGTKEVQ